MAGHKYPSVSRAKRKLYPAYNPPAAEDVENAVIASLLRGEDLEEIFSELDPDCFLESSPRPELFREAKELYGLTGSVSLDILAQKIGTDGATLLDTYASVGRPDLLEYFIKILVQYKLRRAAAREACKILISALDDTFLDDLIDQCRTFLDRLPEQFREAGVKPERRSAADDWYVFPGDPKRRYKVLPGKDDLPDYCRVDGRNVSEYIMFRNGFERVTEK